jgi:hypothetical protein
MRPRFVITLLILLTAVLAFVYWLRPKHGATPPTLISEIIQATNQPVSANTNIVSQNTSRAPLLRNPPESQQTVVAHKVETPEQARQEIESANVPVEFYGQVIDQNSNALPGVEIKAVVRHWVMADPVSMLAGSKDISLERKSGPDGRFELNDATGDGFDLKFIQKDGYEVEPGQRTFGAVGGSFDNPVVFKMWNTNSHEKLVAGERKFKIAPDGRPYFINLMDGTISETGAGDLKVWVKRPEPITSRRYDWSSGMEAMSGDILQENDKNAAMYEAPADGYTKSFSYEEGATANGWGDTTGEQRFYVRLNNGQIYGRISIELEAYYNNQTPGLIRLSYAINPSGSRILR